MSFLQSIVLGRIAERAINSALPPMTALVAPTSPLEQARERLARAEATSRNLDEIERYGVVLSALAGGAIALSRR